MSLKRNTEYYGEQLASDYHRLIGKRCYAGNADMIDYTYQNGHIKPVSIVDYKYPGTVVGYDPSLQFYRYLADQLQVPFYIVLTYLGEEHSVKCYYLIPANQSAKDYLQRCQLSTTPGCWLSLKQFSKFNHALRNLTWNGEEVTPDGKTLKELSNEVLEYAIPTINL